MVTGERRAKGRALLEALERPGISQLMLDEGVESRENTSSFTLGESKTQAKRNLLSLLKMLYHCLIFSITATILH